MRIIAGTAKGLRLAAPPKRLAVRPTLDRVRESLFSILSPRLEGARFLDLFAGTGANGIEALSRGARHAVFAEQHPKALRLIRENLHRAKLEAQAECLRLSLPKDLPRLEGPFDLVYADPPYDFEAHEGLLEAIAACGLTADGAWVIVEHATRRGLPEEVANLQMERSARYGDTTLSFFS